MVSTGSASAFARHCAAFALVIGALWVVFYALDLALPSLRPGHEQIYALAQETIAHGVVFPADRREARVAVFGDSRVQSGFRPDVFDELSGGTAYSFNLGLPDQGTSTDEIRTLVARDQAPDVVVLTNAWDTAAATEGWARLSDDEFVLDRLFPFRHFPRDASLFLIRSINRGGPAAYYAAAQRYVEQARRDRGYFFIEGMSHFAGNQLPDDFRADSDDPAVSKIRELTPEGPIFAELVELQRSAGFRTVFVPTYHRIGAFGPPAPNAETAALLESHGIEVIGPDYWLYPNRLFSDPGHLNPTGAEIYTRDLWQLLAPVVGAAARGSGPPSA